MASRVRFGRRLEIQVETLAELVEAGEGPQAGTDLHAWVVSQRELLAELVALFDPPRPSGMSALQLRASLDRVDPPPLRVVPPD